jgi:hypothetical protein
MVEMTPCISPPLQPSHGEARLLPEQASCCSVQDTVELSRGERDGDCGLIPPTVRADLQSPQPQKKSVTVDINEWVIGSEDTSYIINTAGCGAIKIFVDCEKSGYFIVFHSFGTQDSMNAAAEVGRYILGAEKKPRSVRILDIQPYSITGSVKKTVAVIHKMLEEKGGIKVDGRTVCLNNIEGERYSSFVSVDLQGTEKEILDRYDHLVLKDRNMSDAGRAEKRRLFQSIPLNMRTPELLREWASSSLEEAERLVDEIRQGKKRPVRSRDRLKDRERKADSPGSPHSGKLFSAFKKRAGIFGKDSKDCVHNVLRGAR